MPARDHFRAHERRRVDFPAKLCVHDGSRVAGGLASEPWTGGPKRDVRVRDLGLGGAGIEIPEGALSPSPLDRQRRGLASEAPIIDHEMPVTIELLAPVLWDPLVLEGKVAWIRRAGQGRPTRAGIRFEHREPSVLYGLFQFLGAHVQGA